MTSLCPLLGSLAVKPALYRSGRDCRDDAKGRTHVPWCPSDSGASSGRGTYSSQAIDEVILPSRHRNQSFQVSFDGAHSRGELAKLIYDTAMTIPERGYPILHLEVHGSEQGIKMPNDDIVTWGALGAPCSDQPANQVQSSSNPWSMQRSSLRKGDASDQAGPGMGDQPQSTSCARSCCWLIAEAPSDLPAVGVNPWPNSA